MSRREHFASDEGMAKSVNRDILEIDAGSGGSSEFRIKVDDIDRPDLRAFFDYWKSLTGDRFAPSWREFDLLAIGASSVPRAVVVDVVREPLNFIVRFWGTAHVSRKGVDKTGKSVVSPPVFRGNTPFDEYDWVIREKRPYLAIGTVHLDEFGRPTDLTQQTLRLPLSDDGAEVHHVVSLASWKKE